MAKLLLEKRWLSNCLELESVFSGEVEDPAETKTNSQVSPGRLLMEPIREVMSGYVPNSNYPQYRHNRFDR